LFSAIWNHFKDVWNTQWETTFGPFLTNNSFFYQFWSLGCNFDQFGGHFDQDFF